jgi:hypothetical protein
MAVLHPALILLGPWPSNEEGCTKEVANKKVGAHMEDRVEKRGITGAHERRPYLARRDEGPELDIKTCRNEETQFGLNVDGDVGDTIDFVSVRKHE